MWRSDHPFGFVARPSKLEDGTLNMLRWECEVPGPKESPWDGGFYKMIIDFSSDYPVR